MNATEHPDLATHLKLACRKAEHAADKVIADAMGNLPDAADLPHLTWWFTTEHHGGIVGWSENPAHLATWATTLGLTTSADANPRYTTYTGHFGATHVRVTGLTDLDASRRAYADLRTHYPEPFTDTDH